MKSKQETIKMVTDSVSSIFTKDDVLTLLNNLKADKGGSLSLETAEELADSITSKVSNNLTSYIELSSVTVSYGRYGNSVDDQDYDLDQDSFRDTIMEAITETIPCSDDSAAEENNSTDNQQVSN